MAFTRALYYPWQEILDTAWLKSALLYWDKIATLVPPDDPQPYKTCDAKAFVEGGVLISAFPREGLINEATAKLVEFSQSKAWSMILGGKKGQTINSLAERYKIERYSVWWNDIVTYLGKHKDPRVRDWNQLDSNIATLYLTILAAKHAEHFHQALVTDRPGLRALAESIQIGRPVPEAVELQALTLPPMPPTSGLRKSVGDAEAALGLRVTLESINIDPGTSVEKILRFREKYSYELGNFRSKIGELAVSLSGDYPSFAAFEQAVADAYMNSVIPSIAALNHALRSQKIATELNWISVGAFASVPPLLTEAIGPIGTSVGLAVGGALAVTVQMAKARVATQQVRSKDPYSYVIRARREFS